MPGVDDDAKRRHRSCGRGRAVDHQRPVGRQLAVGPFVARVAGQHCVIDDRTGRRRAMINIELTVAIMAMIAIESASAIVSMALIGSRSTSSPRLRCPSRPPV